MRTQRLGHMTYQSRGCGKGEQKMAKTRMHCTDGESGSHWEAERGQAVNCEDPVEAAPEDQEKFGDLG